jgi:hypothetical protein
MGTSYAASTSEPRTTPRKKRRKKTTTVKPRVTPKVEERLPKSEAWVNGKPMEPPPPGEMISASEVDRFENSRRREQAGRRRPPGRRIDN